MQLYLVTNLIDGTMYVGKTIRPIEKRWMNHLSAARHGSSTHLHNAIRKYGAGAFVVDPLILSDEDFTDDQSLNDGERLMIRLLRVNCKLYNLTDGGEGLSNPSKETRRKMSEANLGRVWSDEARRNTSEARKGKTHSAKTRVKIQKALTGIGRRTKNHRCSRHCVCNQFA